MPTPYLAGGGNAAGGSTTLTVTFSHAVALGDFITVGADCSSGTISGVADSKGNTWTQELSDTSQIVTYIFTAPCTVALTTSDTFTVTYSNSAAGKCATAVGCSGLAGSPVDQVVSASNAGSGAPSVTSGTLAQASEICIAFCGNGNGGGAISWTAFTGLDSEHNGSTQWLGTAWESVASTSAVTAAGTITSTKWCMALITLKASVAGAAGKAPAGVLRRARRPLRRGARLGASASQSGGLGRPAPVLSTIPGPTIPVTATAVPGTTSGATAVVQQVSGTSTYDYGLSTIAMTSTAGNTLILFAGWDLSTQPTSAPMPAVYVTDSAGNYWYHAGTSSALVPGSRSAIWICPNARPVTWLTVSATTFCSSLAYLVAEVSGMPAYYSVDVAATNADNSNTTLTVSPGMTGSADFAFAVFTAGTTGNNPATPSPWTALTTVTAGGGAANPVEIYPYWTPAAPGTSLSATWTTGDAAPLSAVAVGVSAVAAPPVQGNPNFPVVKVEAGFGFDPGDPSQPPLTDNSPAGLSWTDISARAISKDGDTFISSVMGRQYELSQAEAGELHIGIQNWDGAFTPGNTSSPYSPFVVLGTPVRVSAFWNTHWYHIGFGWVEQWPQQWPDLPQFGISAMVATDAISVMASATMPSALDGDMLLDAPYAFIPCSEQYTTFVGGINPVFAAADAQGLLAANTSRVNQRSASYVDGLAATVDTGQATSQLGDSDSGAGTSSISTPPVVPSSGPGVLYTDPAMPDPVTGNGVSVEFWVIVPAAASASLEPVVFSAYGPPGNYGTGKPSLQVKIHAFSGATMTVTLASGATVTVPFNPGPDAQQIVLTLTTTGLQVYVNGGLATTASLAAADTTAWQAVSLGCPNYAYQAQAISIGNFIVFDFGIYPYVLPVQRILSHYVTGFSGQQGVDATARVAQILAWGNLGFARAGQVTFGTPPTSVGLAEGPAYSLEGSSASDAVNKIAVSENGMIVAQPSGALVFIHKWALFNQPTAVTFGDSPAPGTTEVPYLQATSWGYDNTYVYNVTQTTQTVGPNQTITTTAADFNSQSTYFLRSALQQNIETTSDLDAYTTTNWSLAKYAQPSLRVSGVEIDAASNPQAAFGAVLPLQQGQVAQVIRRPVGGAVISGTVLVQKIQHDIGPTSWRTTCQLSPYQPENAVLELGATGFDVLGNNTLA